MQLLGRNATEALALCLQFCCISDMLTIMTCEEVRYWRSSVLMAVCDCNDDVQLHCLTALVEILTCTSRGSNSSSRAVCMTINGFLPPISKVYAFGTGFCRSAHTLSQSSKLLIQVSAHGKHTVMYLSRLHGCARPPQAHTDRLALLC